MKARESAEPPKRVVDLEEREARDGRRAFPDHGGSRTLRPRLGEEVVRVEPVALEGDEERPGGYRARVRRDGEERRQRTGGRGRPRRARDLLGREERLSR